MITSNAINSNTLLNHLLQRFQRNPVSRSTLVMATHFYLKDNCESSSNKVSEIDDKIDELLKNGHLKKLTDGKLQINQQGI